MIVNSYVSLVMVLVLLSILTLLCAGMVVKVRVLYVVEEHL